MHRKKIQSFVGNHHVVVFVLMTTTLAVNVAENRNLNIGVGVILDMDSYVGKSIRISILMALEDFYKEINNSTTVIIPHFRNSNDDNVDAASAAIDLLKNTQVAAILGPQQSSQAHFVLDIAQRSKVPMISPATNPDLSPIRNPYFIRIAHASSTQAQPIAALVKSFDWREVVFIYEDTDFGREPIPYLSEAMVNVGTQVKYRTLLSPSSSDDRIFQQLNKLKSMQTRVFVVHMLPALASRFFKKADEAGMMTQGYAWIITDVLTSLLHHLDPVVIHSMQGVLGVKPYIPPSNQLTNFERRWRRRFHKEYPDTDRVELDMFGIWSYDSVFGLAIALNRVGTEKSTTFKKPKKATTELAAIGTSEMGPMFLPAIRDIRFKGMSGDFRVVNGQLQTPAYQIVNVFGKAEKQIGFWSPINGISNRTIHNESSDYTTNKDNLGAIIWPGDTTEFPKGLEIPTGGDIFLRVGVPAKGGFVEFIEADIDPKTKEVKVNGFVIDVFWAVLDELPYTVHYNITPYEASDGERIGDYNDLIYQIFLGKFDMVVADATILWNRSNYADFTLPYTESGVSMLVPARVDDSQNIWIFMRPLETKLWITIGAFFIYTGFVVWVIEHRVNKEFRGPPHQHVGLIFWFSFSTLFFAQKEKMVCNLSRFVVIVWLLVVLVLTSSYTASFASMLTVQKLQPTITDIYELIAKGEYVGYQDGSFLRDKLKDMGFSSDKLKSYSNFQEYADALSNGSRNNGVAAIIDDVPYLKMLMAKYCNKYMMVGPTYKSAGFGFAFPKKSPLVDDFSRAILKVIEGKMNAISNKWFGNEAHCPDSKANVQPFEKLTLASFRGLFLISGLTSTYALAISMFKFLYENKEVLVSEGSIYQKLTVIALNFDVVKDRKPSEAEKVDNSHICVEENKSIDQLPDPTISVDHQDHGVSSPTSQI
ncbi:hypothetical protein L2E82_47336 [Cichorium intybus]|uniref:Uncharacterized protein n=1 Tax=Cichorium intybus TaxID=13427 RepID=A0ACB8YZD0_CICIN|nr:hypothetical protein L2E82_47336 [Cichorium intybus]